MLYHVVAFVNKIRKYIISKQMYLSWNLLDLGRVPSDYTFMNLVEFTAYS